jgi:uncharacterized membrane protein
MSVTKLLLSYVLTCVVFFAVDLLWLGVVAKKIYDRYLGDFLSDKINWTAAFIFYFLFIIGIFIFSIMPAVNKDSPGHALIMGALFGFFTYATYDLTNLATLKNWPIQIVFIDITWGAILTATVSIAGYYIVKLIS